MLRLLAIIFLCASFLAFLNFLRYNYNSKKTERRQVKRKINSKVILISMYERLNCLSKNLYSERKDVIMNSTKARKGCKDVWNAFMVKGATFTPNDIPLCPTTATELPHTVITWEEAKAIYKKYRIKKNLKFKHDAFVCWYIDDYKFDGPRGIWHDYNFALKVICHFAGAITPDFSTYQDFPEPLKIYNTYRMRAFGYWLSKNGIKVINNIRWGTAESYWYCFDGIDKNTVVAIGTCGGSPRKHIDRKRFENGLTELVNRLQPHTIVVYGSANYACFEKLKVQGINIVAFPSKTAKAFERRKHNE